MKLRSIKRATEYEKRLIEQFIVESCDIESFFKIRGMIHFDVGLVNKYLIYTRTEINYKKSLELILKYDSVKDYRELFIFKNIIENNYKLYIDYISKYNNDQEFLAYKEKIEFEQILKNF